LLVVEVLFLLLAHVVASRQRLIEHNRGSRHATWILLCVHWILNIFRRLWVLILFKLAYFGKVR